jgi:hypothetical protein
MLSKFSRFLIAATTIVYSGSAFAFFDAELLVGKSWYEWDDDSDKTGTDAQQITAAAHLSPIPLVPVAFGLSATTLTFDKTDFKGDVDSFSGMEVGIDFKAWIPMVPIITPYLRFNYPVMANYALKMSSVDGDDVSYDLVATYKASGYHLNIGAKFSPLPLLGILFEVGKGMQKIKIDTVKIDGSKATLDNDDKETQDFNSNTFLVGVQLDI